jgi:hypothetical protein
MTDVAPSDAANEDGALNLGDPLSQPAPAEAAPAADVPSIRDLRLALRDTLKDRETLVREEYIAGRAYLSDLLAASDEVFYAELQLRTGPADRLELLQEYVGNLTKFEAKVQGYLQNGQGRISEVDVLALRAIRIKAQIGMAEVQGASPSGTAGLGLSQTFRSAR